MEYDPIIIDLEGRFLEFYFDRGKHRQWFYEIHDVRNESEMEDWDRHLKEKMWYTPEVRERTIALMKKLYE